MALRGTLKDFGIADVFQLIGLQGKTGRLVVQNRDEKVEVYFREGHVARAAPQSRKRKDLLGSMLVRAETISENDLKKALALQQGTSRRLGEILLETTTLDQETLQAFFKLQTTEALYRLFLITHGTYEFENQDVQAPDPPGSLIRSEQVLMEGFRQVDDWPEIRKKIAGYHLVFQRKEDLEQLLSQEASTKKASDDDPFGDLDAAFDELGGGGGGSGRFKNIADKERLVYALIAAGRDVQKVIDLSRLGEFDTCKALCNLIDAGIIAPAAEGEHKKPSASATVGGITPRRRVAWLVPVLRALLVAGGLVGGYFVAQGLGLQGSALWPAPTGGFVATDVQEVLGRAQLARLDEALAIYRSETGGYPPGLQTLVEAGLVSDEELRFPWRHPYHYALHGEGYVLRRPFY